MNPTSLPVSLSPCHPCIVCSFPCLLSSLSALSHILLYIHFPYLFIFFPHQLLLIKRHFFFLPPLADWENRRNELQNMLMLWAPRVRTASPPRHLLLSQPLPLFPALQAVSVSCHPIIPCCFLCLCSSSPLSMWPSLFLPPSLSVSGCPTEPSLPPTHTLHHKPLFDELWWLKRPPETEAMQQWCWNSRVAKFEFRTESALIEQTLPFCLACLILALSNLTKSRHKVAVMRQAGCAMLAHRFSLSQPSPPGCGGLTHLQDFSDLPSVSWGGT